MAKAGLMIILEENHWLGMGWDRPRRRGTAHQYNHPSAVS